MDHKVRSKLNQIRCVSRKCATFPTFSRILPKFPIFATICYICTPMLHRTKTLPTPIIYNGVSESEFFTPFYLFCYVALFYSTLNVVLSMMATDCFFAITAIMLGNRFATMSGLMKLLNYEGERDRKKDQELIKYCYLMHLEVME